MTASISIQIDIHPDELRAFCRRWNIVQFALFGSVLRDDFHDGSDVDVLVTFRAGTTIHLAEWIALGDELQAWLGREVDVMTRRSIEDSPNYLRRRMILDSAQVIYEE